jgi:UDP-N-acetylmuramoyl-L-alanyl-D-glutamate--2,6-diaminopimelate ligase
MAKRLSELIAAVPEVVRVTGDADVCAPVVESDADVQPGRVFVARPGLRVDGRDFVPRVIERRASTVAGERDIGDLAVPYVQAKNAQESVGYLTAAYYDFRSPKLVGIGVTGTDGNTTTATLIESFI